ncbi:DNA cytosine methyltransferase [Aeromonas salmonicida]|uniref:DNA cytosine methyltransferase n=1 Tax=Aeromonas salmonicida TaxID=645 RepID=UPI0031FE00D4
MSFKAIDLFSGAGGFSLAALELNINILSAIEFDKHACETYKKNIVDKQDEPCVLLNSDIMDVDPISMMNSLDISEGELDIIIGGPPCQGFSSHRIKNSGVDDPRNNLLIRYFDFVSAYKPKLFLVENVPGLLWERHQSYLNDFKSLAQKNDYKIMGPLKLNAKNYGVPQNRSRVFILGVRNDIHLTPDAWPPKPTHFENKQPLWLNASSVFEKPSKSILKSIAEAIGYEAASNLQFNEHQFDKNDPLQISMNHSGTMIERFAMTPINGGRYDIDFRLPCHDHNYRGHSDVYGRIRLSQPGPTITTGCYNPSKGRFLHPWENHGITLRHAARFQTFPDDYVFLGGVISQGKQIGNAVPVLMGKALLNSCLDILKANG